MTGCGWGGRLASLAAISSQIYPSKAIRHQKGMKRSRKSIYDGVGEVACSQPHGETTWRLNHAGKIALLAWMTVWYLLFSLIRPFIFVYFLITASWVAGSCRNALRGQLNGMLAFSQTWQKGYSCSFSAVTMLSEHFAKSNWLMKAMTSTKRRYLHHINLLALLIIQETCAINELTAHLSSFHQLKYGPTSLGQMQNFIKASMH